MRIEAAFATLLALLAVSASVRAETVEQRTAFGAVVLVQEVRTRDPGQPPIMHMADEWTKLHLRWTAATGDMTIEIVDDGHALSIAADGHECALRSTYERYARQTGEPALWRQMQAYLQQLAKVCPRISRVEVRAYGRALAGAEDDFVAGVEALKKRAALVFKHDLGRCRPRRVEGTIIIPSDPFADRCDGTW